MKKVKEILPWASVILVFLWIGLRYYYDGLDKQKVFDNHNFAIGRIIKYGSSGAYRKYYIVYQFELRGQIFTKNTKIPYKLFPSCEYNLSICSNKRFWVAYQKENPSNSLINSYIEIQDIENPKPPENLDNFR